MRPRAGALLSIALLSASATSHASPVRGGVRLEAGAEHDSNATRVETVEGAAGGAPVVACPVARFAASGDLFTAPAAGTTFSLGGGLAGKRFLSEEARGEDVLVGEGRVGATVALGARTALGLQAAYYEIFQRAEAVEEARDFRSLLPT